MELLPFTEETLDTGVGSVPVPAPHKHDEASSDEDEASSSGSEDDRGSKAGGSENEDDSDEAENGEDEQTARSAVSAIIRAAFPRFSASDASSLSKAIGPLIVSTTTNTMEIYDLIMTAVSMLG